MGNGVYVCPDCREPLDDFRCAGCEVEFPCADGIPRLLSRNPKFERAFRIAAAYDSIYGHLTNVWENQGRTPEFLRYFSSLLGRFPSGRVLEIGCGEGFLLALRPNGENYGVDLSREALRRARARARGHFSLALAERLPFPDGTFDLVASAGVMEHFLDIPEALQEIRRVLKPGGHYVSLTHVDLTLGDRLALKTAEFVFPRPRPLRLLRWLRTRWGARNGRGKAEYVRQPIQNRYTTRGVRAWLEKSGFRTLDVIHTRKQPELPLAGPWVVIYVAQRPAHTAGKASP